MSYGTVFQCVHDGQFAGRVQACCAQEGADNPEETANGLMWEVAAAADIEAAYASAVASGNPNPGGDDSVITDQMILSAVQPHLPAP